jgi:hypothetical protein
LVVFHSAAMFAVGASWFVTDPRPGPRLHGAADQALADRGETLQPLEARLADLDRQRLRAAMGAEAFEAEYAAGRTLALSSRSLISRSPGGLGRRSLNHTHPHGQESDSVTSTSEPHNGAICASAAPT